MKLNKIKNQIGATAIEYALLAGLVAVASITVFSLTGNNLSNVYCNVSYVLGAKSCNGNTNPADLSVADKLQNSLSDKLDLNYLDASQGGTGGHWNPGPWQTAMKDNIADISGNMQGIANRLEALNAQDPITNVFGIYDRSGNVINDYATALAGFKSGGSWMDNNYNLNRNYNYDLDTPISSMTASPEAAKSLSWLGSEASGVIDGVEVTTQSGKVYKINYGHTTEEPSK